VQPKRSSDQPHILERLPARSRTVPGRVEYLLVAVDIERCLRDDFDEVSRLACAAGAMVQLRGERLREG
jgi:hypothetical protein